MKSRRRTRSGAWRASVCAAAGLVVLLSQADAQDYRERKGPGFRAAPLYGSGTYRSFEPGLDDDGLIKPLPVRGSAPELRPTRVSPGQSPDVDSGTARDGRLESQVTTLKETRVAELEAEVAELKQRLDVSGEMFPSYDGCPGSCGPAGCGGCCQPCCPPIQTGFYGGFEFLWLQPNFDNSIAFLSSGPGQAFPDGSFGGVAQRSDARSHDFDYDFELSPRIFVGWTHECGWGIRSRYFEFDHSSNRPFVSIPANGDAETPAFQPYLGSGDHFFMDHGIGTEFQAAHSLELQAWDLEATNQLVFCRSLVTAGLGLRYVGIEQRYRADTIWVGTDILETLYYNHDFYGAGPTVSLEMLRPFSCCSGLAFYAGGRGSVVFGERTQYFKKEDGATGAVTETFTRRDADTAVYIAEVGLGLQYTRGIFFGRAGWEGQWWDNAGGPTTTDGDLGLHGISLTLGLNY